MTAENFWQMLSGIWEGYKELIAWIVIIFWIVFFIVGGNIHVEFYWRNVTEFFKTLKRMVQ